MREGGDLNQARGAGDGEKKKGRESMHREELIQCEDKKMPVRKSESKIQPTGASMGWQRAGGTEKGPEQRKQG